MLRFGRKRYFVKFNTRYLTTKSNLRISRAVLKRKALEIFVPGPSFKRPTNCRNAKIRIALSYLKTNSLHSLLAYFQNNSCRSQVTFCSWYQRYTTLNVFSTVYHKPFLVTDWISLSSSTYFHLIPHSHRHSHVLAQQLKNVCARTFGSLAMVLNGF